MKRLSIAVLLFAACASHPAPLPVHYAIVTATEVIAHDAETDLDHLRQLRAAASNDLLWFERDGIEYISSDPATVATAMKASRQFERELAELKRVSPESALIVTYSAGAPPISPEPPQSNVEEHAAWQQAGVNQYLDNRLSSYTSSTDAQAQRQRLEDNVNRAAGGLEKIIDDAIARRFAQPIS
jgi:hypothetical protein